MAWAWSCNENHPISKGRRRELKPRQDWRRGTKLPLTVLDFVNPFTCVSFASLTVYICFTVHRFVNMISLPKIFVHNLGFVALFIQNL